MMEKVKAYFNGSMEPEPEQVDEAQNTPSDLETAGRAFYILGVFVIAASLVLFPVIGFHITLIFFGIVFIGISILLKSQDRIIKLLNSTDTVQDQIRDCLEDKEA